jgi:hypothetical protein
MIMERDSYSPVHLYLLVIGVHIPLLIFHRDSVTGHRRPC